MSSAQVLLLNNKVLSSQPLSAVLTSSLCRFMWIRLFFIYASGYLGSCLVQTTSSLKLDRCAYIIRSAVPKRKSQYKNAMMFLPIELRHDFSSF